MPAAAPATPAQTAAASTVDALTTSATVQPTPRPHAPRRRGPRRWQWSAIAGLSLLLGLQLLLADRARLAAAPGWRPWLERTCGLLRCTLPPWREPGAFSMLDRKVRPAATPGVLQVQASFRNDARWPQAWPALQLALADADGRTLGSQVFTPEQYLGASADGLIAPGQSAQIGFLVQEPAPGTIAFSFEFR